MIALRIWLVRGSAATAAGLLAVLLLGALLRGPMGEPGEQEAVRHVPPDSVPRLRHVPTQTIQVMDVGIITDFDARDSSLVILDAMTARVVVLERHTAGWKSRLSFGARGGGPGELQSPTGITIAADGGIVVADENRLHRFNAAGHYERTILLTTECELVRPSVAAGSHGLFVTGTCRRSGQQTDSLVAVVYWSPDDSTFIELASDLRYILGARTGLPLGSRTAFTDGSARHLFGVGTTNCIYRIVESDSTPAVSQVCGLVSSLYKAPAPPSVEERMRLERARRPEQSGLLRWPDALPVYMGAMSTVTGDVLLRPFAADSVVFEIVPARREVLAAPLDGLIGCRRYGCMWAFQEMDGARVTLLRTEDVAALIASRESRK